MHFKGDIGLFREALLNNGFATLSKWVIFNDNSHYHTRRRLKLWFAKEVFDATQKKQRALEQSLRLAFGDRIIEMYFIESSNRVWRQDGIVSLCIKLRD